MTGLWSKTAKIGCGLIMVVACHSAINAQSVGKPSLLPAQPFDYVGYAVDYLPSHFSAEIDRDSTPADNPITNDGATLGRVLFYDKRLSHGNSMSCSSCHFQENGFSQPTATSLQNDGEQTQRHSMALVNTQFFGDGALSGRMLSDLSAPTLEAQTLMPINSSELGIGALGDANIDAVVGKLEQSSFYNELFLNAFGQPSDPDDTVISSDRIANALAQFVRSMVSYDSKFDSIFDADGNEDPALVAAAFNDQERLGKELFHGRGQCSNCHQGNSQTTLQTHNNGLDLATVDSGAGDGMFKSASLRNVEVRGRFMHDGRFETLEEVVDFYSDSIQDHPNLDFRLREGLNQFGDPLQIGFSEDEAAAVVAFLKTLTDDGFLTDERFSDPFVLACDFDENAVCDTDDLDRLLAEHPNNAVAPNGEMYDLNGDGVLDIQDTSAWLADAAEANGLTAAYRPGDANLDGKVDIDDFHAWNANRFTESTAWSDGDFNGDGFIDVSDFNTMNTNRSSSEADWPQQVPEPRASVWASLLLCILVSRQLRRS